MNCTCSVNTNKNYRCESTTHLSCSCVNLNKRRSKQAIFSSGTSASWTKTLKIISKPSRMSFARRQIRPKQSSFIFTGEDSLAWVRSFISPTLASGLMLSTCPSSLLITAKRLNILFQKDSMIAWRPIFGCSIASRSSITQSHSALSLWETQQEAI